MNLVIKNIGEDEEDASLEGSDDENLEFNDS